MKRALLLLASAHALGCDDDAPAASADARAPVDAPADVTSPGIPWSLRAAGEGFAVTVSGSPARLRLERAGSSLLESPAGMPLLLIGVRDGGLSPTRLSDPRLPDPSGVTWVAPTAVRSVDEAGGTVTLTHPATGDVVLRLVRTNADTVSLVVEAQGPDAAMIRFDAPSDGGGYHGLGEQFAGADARGRTVPMQFHVSGPGVTASSTNEAHVPVPFMVSTRGYGVFVETYEAGAFDVGATEPARWSARFEGARATLHLFAQATPRAVIAAYTRLTGLPRLPPAWSFGHQQWRNAWDDDAQVLEDARRLRSEGIPTSTMWIDNPWQTSYSDHTIDRARFRDPEAMMATLRSLGYRVIFWSVPFLDAVADGETPQNPAERLWVQARERQLLLRASSGRPYITVTRYGGPSGMPNANGSPMDWTNPEATAFWVDQLRPIIEAGARGFKLDYAEDVVSDIAGTRPGFRFFNGDTERRGHWFYPQGYHAAYRAALDRWAGGDGFLIGRASSWGGQRISDVIWPGDLDNDFTNQEGGRVGGLRAAIHGMISLSESGFPSYASDTGGYRGGMPGREVLLRWAEHTALSPFMQLGGGGDSHNPWAYDAEAVIAYRGLARLHDDLTPYYIEHATRASMAGTPPVVSAAVAFPDEPGSARDPEAYLLGDDLFVAPVVTVGATTRIVHVPPGTWVHWWTGAAYVGPTDVTIAAPIGQPVLLAREGAGIAMNPQEVQSLVPTDGDQVIDLGDRASIRRLTAFPGPTATTRTWSGGSSARVERTATGWTLAWAAAAPVSVLRSALVVGPQAAMVTGVSSGSAAFARSADAREGRCTRCWDADATRGVVWLVQEGAGEATIARGGT
jgi:alpha-D-xyloside xylohydrolase